MEKRTSLLNVCCGMLQPWIDQLRQQGSITLTVRVHPGTVKTAVKEVMSDGTLKVDVRAPADAGKANVELVRFLAQSFLVPAAHIQIVAGAAFRRKIVRIRDATPSR
jgi:uncharacterized protein (TIGR00251 family)